jgi:hypothetical protein
VSETVWRATIFGEPVAAREAGQAAVVQGLLRVVKSDAARLWVARAVTQLSGRRPVRPFSAKVSLECRVWSGDPGTALDERLIGEALERAAVLVDARQIRETHRYGAVDRCRPRVDLVLRLAETRRLPADHETNRQEDR